MIDIILNYNSETRVTWSDDKNFWTTICWSSQQILDNFRLFKRNSNANWRYCWIEITLNRYITTTNVLVRKKWSANTRVQTFYDSFSLIIQNNIVEKKKYVIIYDSYSCYPYNVNTTELLCFNIIHLQTVNICTQSAMVYIHWLCPRKRA